MAKFKVIYETCTMIFNRYEVDIDAPTSFDADVKIRQESGSLEHVEGVGKPRNVGLRNGPTTRRVILVEEKAEPPKTIVHGECLKCGLTFDEEEVVCCCSNQTETGKEVGQDGIEMPFTRHTDAYCVKCCGHVKNQRHDGRKGTEVNHA